MRYYLEKYWSMQKIDVSSINTQGLNSPIEWNLMPTGIKLFIAEKQIISLGEGTTVNFTDDISNPKKITNKSQELDKFEYKYKGESSPNSLPSITSSSGGSNGTWKIFSRLQLSTSPTQGQFLDAQHKQAVALYEAVIDDNNENKVTGYTRAAILNAPQYITTNNIVALPGGVKQNSAVMTSEGKFENSLSVYVTGKSISAQSKINDSFISNASTIEEDSITITEYDDQIKISISDSSADDLGGKFEFDLSPQFNNSLLPILFSGNDDSILYVTATATYVDNAQTIISGNILKDMADNPSQEISGLSNKYLNYYKLYHSANTLKKFTLTLEITHFKTNAQIILFKPLKIKEENNLLLCCVEKDDPTTSVKSKVNTLATVSKNGRNINLFDYSYQIDEEDLIENPLEAESFFKPNHIYNKYIIAQLDTGTTVDKKDKLNIRVANQSLQSPSRGK